MSRRAILITSARFLSTAILVLSLRVNADARACRVTLIPNGTKNGCANCHINRLGGGPRNAFGNAVAPLVGLTCGKFWGPQLAALDSDGDGLTNGEELGDPEGKWSLGMPQPGDPNAVLNPGVKDAVAPAIYVRGDANSDGRVDISDAGALLLVLFAGKPPIPCKAAEDANGDGTVDVSDAVFVLDFLFSGGPAPPAPYPDCGSRASRLPCESHAACD